MTPVEIASEFASLGYYVFPLYKGRGGIRQKPFGWARNNVLDPEKADKAIPATNDPVEVETWPKRIRSGYNSVIVGFGVLGIGCVILDLDVKGGKNGISEFANMVKESGAQGLVLFMQQFCDPEEMEFPYLKKALDAAGIPFIKLGIDQQMRDFGQAATAIQAFADVLSVQ